MHILFFGIFKPRNFIFIYVKYNERYTRVLGLHFLEHFVNTAKRT